MDIQAYIDSGILEQYAIGIASPQERQEVECLSSIYPEIKSALVEIESGLEGYAASQQAKTPEYIKAAVLEKIKNVPQDRPLNIIHKANSDREAKRPANSQFWKYAAAFAFILCSGVSVFWFLQKNENDKIKLALSEKENLSIALNNRIQTLTDSIAEKENFKLLLTSEGTEQIVLKGTPKSPDSKVFVYWNQKENKAYASIANLPKPDSEHQYQLWAISNGVPIDLGVLDKVDKAEKSVTLNTTNIQAFAITLEANGGKPSPNLEELYVIGNTKS